MVANGYLTEAERSAAEKDLRLWGERSARQQRLYLLCADGQRSR